MYVLLFVTLMTWMTPGGAYSGNTPILQTEGPYTYDQCMEKLRGQADPTLGFCVQVNGYTRALTKY